MIGLQNMVRNKIKTPASALAFGLIVGAGMTCGGAAHAQTRAWATSLTNIAAAANGGRIVNVSSTIDKGDPQFAASNLIDGQVFNTVNGKTSGSFGWASDRYDPVNMEYVTLGFKDNALHSIGKIVINPTTNVAPERWVKDVEVQASTTSPDGPYNVVAQLTVLKKAQAQAFTILPASARFVRLMFRTNWGSDRAVAMGEVEMYDAVDAADPLGGLITRMEGAVNELKQYRQTQQEIGGTIQASAPDIATSEPVALPNAIEGPQTQLTEPTLQLIKQITGNAAPGGAAPVATSLHNIAAAANGGKIVDYSSIFVSDPAQGPDPDYGPDKLIDGQNFLPEKNTGSFGWASQGFAPSKQFVTIGFRDDRTHVINRIVVNPSSNQSSLRWARRIEVQVTTNAAKTGPWQTIATLNLRLEVGNQEFKFASTEAKYVRFVFTANGPGDVRLAGIDPDVNSDRSVSLGEIEIYEPVAESAALDAVIGNLQQILVDMKRVYEQQGKAPA